jgi:ribosome-binding factor A
LRRELASRLTVRFMPEILFKLDNSIEQGSRILGLIREMENEGKATQASEQAEDAEEVAHDPD